MSGVNEPPLPGMIRLFRRPVPEFLSLPLFTQDRSLSQWFDLCDEYETFNGVPQQEYTAEEPYNPFVHSAATGRLLRKEIFHQLKLRRIIRTWVSRIRIRQYRRRLVGDTDLQTLEPIAPKDAVQVVCHRTKSIYQFHVTSLIRMIRENLYFEQWGRADPMEPRNPYTNQPWSLPQLVELIHTIHKVLVNRRSPVPTFLTQFVEARYSVDTFYTKNRLALGIAATAQFFQTPDSSMVRSELLSQLFEQIGKLHKMHLYRLVQRGSCISPIQEGWESLLQNKWIHDNYGYSPKYMWRDTLEQTMTIQQIFHRSMQWYNVKYPSVVILAVREPPSSEEEESDADSQ
jgi:hypothetical protein